MFVSREAITYGLDNFTKGDSKTDILKAEVRETILDLLIDDRGVDKSFPSPSNKFVISIVVRLLKRNEVGENHPL